MGPKINFRARIERHSRVLSEHKKFFWHPLHTKDNGYKVVSFLVLFLLPIYPTFSLFVSDVSESEFSRAYIDESTILSSYFGAGNTLSDGEIFIQSKDSFLYINAPIDSERDVTWSSEVVEYEVKSWESFAFIAQKFNVSKDTIYWANNMKKGTVLHPGDVIKVPPVSGIVHTVKSWETLSGIAKKYNIEEQKIMRQNLLLSASDLKADATIIVPWAKKEEPKPVIAAAPKNYSKPSSTVSNSSSGWGYSFAAKAQSEYVNTAWKYQLVWRKPFSGVPGNCTWYVASHKWVNWRGNANQWLRNARAKGHPTGNNPTIGAIVQFEGRGYNPYYGHVAIVTDVTDTHIIVSDMNYRRKYEVTTRKVPKSDRTIQWYIYID